MLQNLPKLYSVASGEIRFENLPGNWKSSTNEEVLLLQSLQWWL